jgi:hypothetical protein
VKLGQILELRGRVNLRRGRRRHLLVLRLLRGVLLRVLLVPLRRLPALHAPGHGGGGSRDDRSAGCHP